jgi:glutaredoxin
MLKPRIIKSSGCPRCKIYLKTLSKQGYDYIIYDADLKENQKELDKWKINMMPVVQIVDIKDKDGETEMVFQFPPGQYSSRHIDAKIKALNKEREKKK